MNDKTKLVAYYRESTSKQGIDGLGMEAQKTAVESYAISIGAKIVAPPFIEVESGKHSDRPELQKAIIRAKSLRAVLVVAKLDRLSRDPDFLGMLMKSGVEFVACDNPSANKLTIRILAAVAEAEREATSARTKAALAAYKARGGVLGAARPECRDNLSPEAGVKGRAAAAAVRSKLAADHLADILPLMRERRAAGETLQAIADRLNADGYTTRRGNPFTHVQVKLALDRE